MQSSEAIQINLGYIGHLANEFAALEQAINEDGYFAKFRNYTDLFGNEGTEIITTASEEYIKTLITP